MLDYGEAIQKSLVYVAGKVLIAENKLTTCLVANFNDGSAATSIWFSAIPFSRIIEIQDRKDG